MFDLATLTRPIVQAPMAGGPGTTALALAVSEAGGLGFLAAGYKTPDAVRAEVEELRRLTDRPFGVNVFVPDGPPADPAALDRYRSELAADARRLDATVGEPVGGDDDWDAKLELLSELRVPVVSFTFGCPPGDVVAALRGRGSTVVVTVTTPAEAREAAERGADVVCAQGIEAGAHQGSFTNDRSAGDGYRVLDLLGKVREAVSCPVIATGGLAGRDDVDAVLASGAVAAQLGTSFLLCPESGTNPVHRRALTDARFDATVVTRAFTGRPARGLVNRFTRDHADAPAAYPHVHQMTQPLRRAALQRGDADAVNLWAGTGYRHARARPAAEIVEAMSPAPPTTSARGRSRGRQGGAAPTA